ncbi:hypothetical protein CTEN210_06108 [Chaetoceros tenuissimus]|uniref:Circumsporozoite protein n=1 Tax=Chaetoceros tenuissimus TaxID=426638 RepID=A0AAD3CP87_9STRA|nr:hypothetical protein CTEN210_06108 [Chaetoceros tenuissimus]
MRLIPILLVAASHFHLAKANIFCENNPSYTFTFNNKSRDCDWLLSADQATRSNICNTNPVVRQACPFSCSVCCKDNPFYRLFDAYKRMYSCGDIGNNANLQELYCDLSRGPYAKKVKETCPEACGYCPAPLTVTSLPTNEPSSLPTNHPSGRPSTIPTILSSSHPSISPTIIPSNLPTNASSSLPTYHSSGQPSTTPTILSSSHPSIPPTVTPSNLPTNSPSSLPIYHTSRPPSTTPTILSFSQPSVSPSGTPSNLPTNAPSSLPSQEASGQPSTSSTSKFPAHVSVNPTAHPASSPSSSPSSQPNFATKLNEESADDEKLSDSFVSKTYNSQVDANMKSKRDMKMIYIIVGSICTCFVILGLVIFRRRKRSYDYAESDIHEKEMGFFDMVMNSFGYVYQGSGSSSDSDEFSLGNSFDSSETEKYVKIKVRG